MNTPMTLLPTIRGLRPMLPVRSIKELSVFLQTTIYWAPSVNRGLTLIMLIMRFSSTALLINVNYVGRLKIRMDLP